MTAAHEDEMFVVTETPGSRFSMTCLSRWIERVEATVMTGASRAQTLGAPVVDLAHLAACKHVRQAVADMDKDFRMLPNYA